VVFFPPLPYTSKLPSYPGDPAALLILVVCLPPLLLLSARSDPEKGDDSPPTHIVRLPTVVLRKSFPHPDGISCRKAATPRPPTVDEILACIGQPAPHSRESSNYRADLSSFFFRSFGLPTLFYPTDMSNAMPQLTLSPLRVAGPQLFFHSLPVVPVFFSLSLRLPENSPLRCAPPRRNNPPFSVHLLATRAIIPRCENSSYRLFFLPVYL